MLKLYLPDELKDRSDVVRNVDEVFYNMAVKDTETNRKLIEQIEEGTYYDTVSYIDRFGIRSYYEDISIGCKVALSVAQNPDKIFDTVECGNNARDAIILNCKEGSIIFYDMGVTIRDKCIFDTPIDVDFCGNHFTTTGKFNSWLIR